MTRHGVVVVVVACLLALVRVSGIAHARPAENCDIVGTIVDSDASPVANATVTIADGGPIAMTAANGSFQLTGATTTNIVVEVVADGFAAKRVPVLDAEATPQLLIVIVRAEPLVPPAVRTRMVGGVVSDTSRAPIRGAMVRIHGTGIQTVTAVDGTFTLPGAALDEVALDVDAPRRPVTRVTVPKDKATVLVTVGDPAPPTTPTTPAVRSSPLLSSLGIPGLDAALRGRGTFSVRGSTPIYVVDGVIVSNTAVSMGLNALIRDNPVDRLADLDPNDIDTVEVLKGASATGLYGSRAANGVVVITTKRGRAGENHATVTQRFGFAQASRKLGSRTFATIDDVRAAFCSSSESVARCDMGADVQAYLAANGQTYDHEAEILRTAFANETVGTVTGGSDKATYYGSVRHRDEPGVVRGTSSRKQNGRLVLDFKLGARVRLGVTANLIHSLSERGFIYNDLIDTSLYEALSRTHSFVDILPRNGIYPGNLHSSDNVVQTVDLLQNREEVWRVVGGVTPAIDAYASTDGTSMVKLIGNLGADRFAQYNRMVSPSELLFESDDDRPGTVNETSTTDLHWNAGAGALWTLYPQSRTFRSALSAGLTYESADVDLTSITGVDLLAGQQNVSAGRDNHAHTDTVRTTDSGVYAQEEIAVLDDRLSLLAGVIGLRASRNRDTRKYFLYPKLVAAYSLVKPGSGDREALDMFETLRVRTAYAEAGNSRYYRSFAQLVAVTDIDGNPGLAIGYPDPDKPEPERERDVELGLDLATTGQRVVVELTGYQRQFSQLVLNYPVRSSVPGTDGFVNRYVNCCSMRQRGVEATIQVRPIATEHVDWVSRATLALNRSIMTDTGGRQRISSGPGHGPWGSYLLEDGKSPTQIVATIGGSSMVVGDAEPDFRVGWSNVLSFGDVTLAAHIDWQQGSNIVNVTRFTYDGYLNSPDVEAANQRLETSRTGDIRPYVEDASFVKLREVTVSYALPRRLAAQLGPVKRLELALSGRNLWTFTRYSGLDPELSNVGFPSLAPSHDLAPSPPSQSYWLSVTAGI